MGMNYSGVFKMLAGGKKTFFAGATVSAKFIYGLFSKWYYIIASAAIVVTYNVFKALEKAGILDKIQENVVSALETIIHVSVDCPGRLINFQDFLRCLGI